MRCGQCVDEICPHRRTDGECYYRAFAPSLMQENAIQAKPTDFDGIRTTALSLIETVEGYICPKKGDRYVSRTEVLIQCNKLKKMLNEKTD